jgi:hypothetical protein
MVDTRWRLGRGFAQYLYARDRPCRIERARSTKTAGCIGGRLTRVTGHPAPPDPAPPPPLREAVQRWRLVLARDPLDAELPQRSQQTAWEAALVDSGLPLAGLDGPRGRPRFALAAPLALSIPGEAELLDLWLTRRLPRWQVLEVLARVLPAGHGLVDVYDVWLGEAPLPGRVTASVYRAVLDPDVPAALLRDAAAALCMATTLPRTRQKGETTVAYDLRPFVDGIQVTGAAAGGGGPVVRMTLRHDPEKGVGRPEELLAALAARAGIEFQVRSLVRERLVLAEAARTEVPSRAGGPAPRQDGSRPRPRRSR